MAPLRVLHLFDTYLPNTENWLFRLLDNLPDTQIVAAAANFVPCDFYAPRFEYLKFPIRQRPSGAAPGALTQIINKAARGALRLYPRYVAQRAHGIDVMHSHFATVGWKFLSTARQLKVPHIVSFYGYDYEHLLHVEPIWNERYQQLFAQADLFLCEGSHGARTLERLGCRAEKIRVARLGVDTARIPFTVRAKQPGELKLLQMATLIEKKGHIFTVRAFIEAFKRCPNMTLTIVGRDRGNIRPALQEALRGTAAENAVEFVEQVDFGRLHEYMNGFQAFIHPSCYSATRDCEGGAPVVFLDAQACGLPVISTTHCDIPDEVLHEKTGLLCPEKDVAGLASAIERFYAMPHDEYAAFARRGRQHVEANYDARTNAAAVRAIYGELAQKN